MAKQSRPPDSETQRTPQAPEAERAILAAMLQDPIAIAVAQDNCHLKPDEFYFGSNRTLCSAIYRQFARRCPVDVATLAEELRREDELTKVGGMEYLLNLGVGQTTVANVEAYAADIQNSHLKRWTLVQTAQVNELSCNGATPQQIAAYLQSAGKELQDRAGQNDAESYTTGVELAEQVQGTEWLWPGRIAKGVVSAIVGETGRGKSYVTLDVVRCVTQKLDWPDGQKMPDMGESPRVLWIEGESRQAILMERSVAMGITLESFIFPNPPTRDLKIDIEADWQWIVNAVRRHRPALVVLDSLSGANSRAENKADEQKVILQKLAALAAAYNVAVVVVHHLSKPQPGEPEWPVKIHRLRGSSAIAQFCIAIHAVGIPDPKNPAVCAMDCIKLNLAATPPPLGYSIDEVGPLWCEEVPVAPRPKSQMEIAVEFLREILADGPKLSNYVKDTAEARGLVWSTVGRAGRSIKVRSTSKDPATGHNLMSLS